MQEARWYDKVGDGTVDCHLCPHNCKRIAPGKTGLCRVRKNEDGTLVSLIYERVTSASVDPIEKKPLYHFHPGSDIYSIGTWGCNFRCEFCQNWQISQMEALTEKVTPDEVAHAARQDGSIGVAYTYNEPSMWFEYVFDCAEKVRERGLVNVLVTNGFINSGPASQLYPFIDAMNIDIKGMDEKFYREVVGGKLDPVLASAVQAKVTSHVEITNLVIPTLNDSDAHFERLAKWMAENLGRETPLHLSAYFPRYKLHIGQTPPETLERARAICATHLDFVYVGNVAGESNDTVCRKCGATLVSRRGYHVTADGLTGANCAKCGAESGIVN